MFRRKHRIAVTWMLAALMALPLSAVQSQQPTPKPQPAAVRLDLVQTTIDGLLTLGKQLALAQMAQQVGSADLVEQASAKYAQRMSDRIFQLIRLERQGNALTLGGSTKSGDATGMSQVAVIGVLVALLLPAVQAAREAARRAQSSNSESQQSG